VSAVPSGLGEGAAYDVDAVRAQFPILARQINGRDLVYLDSAASSQRPRHVLDAVEYYETHQHANVHRGVHTLSQVATDAFEGARDRVRRFLNARSAREIIFVRGATEAINLVAQSWGRAHLRPGDEVLITALEHHANIVPWQLACQAVGARLVVAPLNARGELLFDEYVARLSARTRIVAVAHVSNALGTVLPVARIVAAARERGIATLLDGAQAVAHERVDVQALDCDFYCFSSHKIYGPTGIGVLYGRESVLAGMPVWQGGGDMIRTVSFEGSTWNELPHRFEAGTPHISGAIGLAAALDFVEGLGLEAIAAHEQALLVHATEALSSVPGLTLHGTAAHKAGVLSFTLAGIHPHDLGTILDHEGVAIRAGHHCAMPLMGLLGVPATARASFGCYSTHPEVERLVAAVHKAREVFG
jgi:cysteine desulfurase/selenocysteine lyase